MFFQHGCELNVAMLVLANSCWFKMFGVTTEYQSACHWSTVHRFWHICSSNSSLCLNSLTYLLYIVQ